MSDTQKQNRGAGDAATPVLATLPATGEVRHPFFVLWRWWQTLPAEQTRAAQFQRMRCVRLAWSAAATDTLCTATLQQQYLGALLYSLRGSHVHVRALKWFSADAASPTRQGVAAAQPPLYLPLSAALPPDALALPVDSVGAADVEQCIGAITQLADVQTRGEAPERAKALLTQCGGARALFTLQLAMASIVTMPRDNTPLHTNSVAAAIEGYAALVGGLYAQQLPSEESALLAVATGQLPLAAMATDGVRSVPGPTRFVGLPRYVVMSESLHTCLDRARCHCDRATPLAVHLTGRATASLALATLARACERESLSLPAQSDSVLRYSVVADGAKPLLVIWSLVYDLWDVRRYTELVDYWQAQMYWDTAGTAGVAAARSDACAAVPRDSSTATSVTTLRTATGEIVMYAQQRMPSSDVPLLCALYDAERQPLAYTQIGAWAERVTRAHLCELRSDKHVQQYQELVALAARYDKHRFFDTLRRKQVRLESKPPAPAYGTSDLWRTAAYRKLEDSISAKPELLEQFFRHLVAGRKVRAAGALRLQTKGLGFSIGGPYKLCWKEWSPKELGDGDELGGRRGRGLGSMVMHYQKLSDPLEAMNYIIAWTHRQGGADARLGADVGSPRRATLRAEADEREAGRAKVLKLLERCTPVAANTTANRYLRQLRGLADAPARLIEENPALRACTTLRFQDQANAELWHDSHGLVVLADDCHCAQRIYLNRTDGGKRTDMERCKLTMGKLTDADGHSRGVCLQAPAEHAASARAPLCFVAEGPETALSVACAFPEAYVYATLGVHSFTTFMPPRTGCTLLLCREYDTGTGATNIARLMDEACSRLRATSGAVALAPVWPPVGVKDFNDVHQRTPGRPGTNEIRECIVAQLRAAGIAPFADTRGAATKHAVVDLTGADSRDGLETGDRKRQAIGGRDDEQVN